MPTVFLPLRRAQADALAAGRADDVPRSGHAATSALLRAHGLVEPAQEEADYTALSYAGVAALLAGDPLRLVAAVSGESAGSDGNPNDPFGRVVLSRLCWDDVSALFCDEPANLP